MELYKTTKLTWILSTRDITICIRIKDIILKTITTNNEIFIEIFNLISFENKKKATNWFNFILNLLRRIWFETVETV